MKNKLKIFALSLSGLLVLVVMPTPSIAQSYPTGIYSPGVFYSALNNMVFPGVGTAPAVVMPNPNNYYPVFSQPQYTMMPNYPSPYYYNYQTFLQYQAGINCFYPYR